MAPSLRTVERLRLRASSEALVRRAVVRLEDALRTASLPDRGARLVIVRRLSLGRIAATASPQSLALALEAGVASLGGRLVHADEPGADNADAVWFRDALEAHCLAALRAAAGSPLHAWFWPLTLPALKPAGATQPVLRALAFSLAGLDEAPAALPHWTATLALSGHADRLLAALRPGDGAALLGAAGLQWDPPRQRPETIAHAPDTASPGVASLPGALGTNVEREDDRHVFVRAALRRAAARGVATPDVKRSRADAERIVPALTQTRVEGRAPAPAGELARSSEPLLEAGEASPGAGALAAGDRDVAPPARSTEGAVDAGAGSTRAHDRETRRARSARPVEIDGGPAGRVDPASLPGRPTRAGGLLFLVPVLARLGFERWWIPRQEARSGAPDSIAGAIFARLLQRLRVEPGDPMWDIASTSRSAPGFPGRDERWGVWGAISGPPMSPDAWIRACRHLLRRRVRIGLGTLVLRPARLALTPTHADVFFALNAADLRIRRAGLDIDPGWIPWLNRVLTFHYAGSDLHLHSRKETPPEC